MKPFHRLLPLLLLSGCGGSGIPEIPTAAVQKPELLLPLNLAAPLRHGVDREGLAVSAALLRRHLIHPEPHVREAASAALEALGPQGVHYVGLLLFQNPHPEVDWRGRRALSRIGWPAAELVDLAAEGGPAAAPLLAEVLKERTIERAGPAIAALGRLESGKGEARRVLEALLSEPDARTRYHVARALGVLGDRQAVEALEHLGQDEDQGVRFAAAGALKRLGQSEAYDILLKILEDRARLGGAAAETGLYNIACLSALAGDTRKALEDLGAACAAGFHDPAAAAGDPDLYDLRELPQWQALMRSLLHQAGIPLE